MSELCGFNMSPFNHQLLCNREKGHEGQHYYQTNCWTAGPNEKSFTQAEVDALVAAAYEDAWKQLRCSNHEDGPKPWCDQCTHLQSLQKRIAARTPADAQKALEAHDAALREQWDNESFPAKWIEAKVKVRDERIAKLEVENAALRGQVTSAELLALKLAAQLVCEACAENVESKLHLDHLHQHESVMYLKKCRALPIRERIVRLERALLAKSGAAK